MKEGHLSLLTLTFYLNNRRFSSRPIAPFVVGIMEWPESQQISSEVLGLIYRVRCPKETS